MDIGTVDSNIGERDLTLRNLNGTTEIQEHLLALYMTTRQDKTGNENCEPFLEVQHWLLGKAVWKLFLHAATHKRVRCIYHMHVDHGESDTNLMTV
jgi:hypothetical protein